MEVSGRSEEDIEKAIAELWKEKEGRKFEWQECMPRLKAYLQVSNQNMNRAGDYVCHASADCLFQIQDDTKSKVRTALPGNKKAKLIHIVEQDKVKVKTELVSLHIF